MGGVGSGDWYRFDKKTTTAECHSVDVCYLYRHDLLRNGHRFSLRWSRGEKQTAAISGAVCGSHPNRVVFLYRYRPPDGEWEDVQEPVELAWTPCNFGGERPWFLCPGMDCGRRVAVLYGPGRYFLCRHCYDLRYESQRESKIYRALHRAQGIRKKLGGSANMTVPFPGKPKGMHHKIYDRLWREHHEAEMEQLASMKEWLDKLERKTG